jgi:hypothetical protein
MKKAIGPDASIPDSRLVQLLRALGIEQDAPGPSISYIVIPGSAGPRWLLPAQNRFLRVILGGWRPYSASARLAWLGVRLAARTGLLAALPGARQLDLPAEQISRLLTRLGLPSAGMGENHETAPIILVGNPSVTRKLLIFISGGGKFSDQVIKYPLTHAARESIRNEVEILTWLDGRLYTPRLLHGIGEATGAAAQQYLAGRLGSRACKPGYLDLLVEMPQSGELRSLRAERRALGQRLRSSAAYDQNASVVDSALALLDQELNVPTALVHGDFAPWNIRELADGAITLIDWESANREGLPLHDLCHFIYMQTRLFTPREPFYSSFLRDGSWRTYCQRRGLSLHLLAPLVAAYLLQTLAIAWESSAADDAKFCLNQLVTFSRQRALSAK